MKKQKNAAAVALAKLRANSAGMSLSQAGALGGYARAAAMTPDARSESSRIAAMARWKKKTKRVRTQSPYK